MARAPKVQPKVVLVIDDDASHVHVCERVLKGAGYSVLTARTGGEALRTLAGSKVDLMLVDVFMPDMDGIEIIQDVRRRAPGVAVVAMSGGGVVAGADHVLAQCTKLGARGALAKPFTPEQLLATVAAGLAPR
jgi:CheY-like chemotaxis protein